MPWGSWHKPNSRDRHRKICFDVEYQSNNLGARDNEIYDKNLPNDSIILIGDSFIEGMGVNLQDTFGEILEKEIGRKVLNFGSGGFFGPVQEAILYASLASKLPHNEIIYFFLPANDFVENEPEKPKEKVRGLGKDNVIKDNYGIESSDEEEEYETHQKRIFHNNVLHLDNSHI